jgi:Lon protease-like protein
VPELSPDDVEKMTVELEIPKRIPVMTLPDTVFFPQAMLPLHIFETGYRKMLRDVLSNHRMFAVSSAAAPGEIAPDSADQPRRVATAGIIRACKKNSDGTSNLLLQGLCRISFTKILSETPYRSAAIDILPSVPGKNLETLLRLKGRLLGCIGVKRRLGETIPGEVLSFLKSIDEPDVVIDLAAFSLCEDHDLKQRLLETVDTSQRLELFIDRLRRDIADIRLRRKMQGSLDDEDVWMN